MKKLLEFLFSGCWHQWEVYKEVGVIDKNVLVVENQVPVPLYRQYTLRCKHCGEMKIWNSQSPWSF